MMPPMCWQSSGANPLWSTLHRSSPLIVETVHALLTSHLRIFSDESLNLKASAAKLMRLISTPLRLKWNKKLRWCLTLQYGSYEIWQQYYCISCASLHLLQLSEGVVLIQSIGQCLHSYITNLLKTNTSQQMKNELNYTKWPKLIHQHYLRDSRWRLLWSILAILLAPWEVSPHLEKLNEGNPCRNWYTNMY